MKYTDSNLINQKFNRWKILSFIKKYGRTYYKCICECGNIKDVKPSHLFKGLSKSCGCLIKEHSPLKGRNSKFLLPDNLAAKRNLYNRYKNDALRRNLEFNLTLDEFINMVTKDCDYCNKPSDKINKMSRSRSHFSYTGIDRKNNKLGYTVNNITSCCTQCNIIKNHLLTYEEMKAAMSAILELRKKNE